MPLADISFECPHCEGPLIAELAHAGLKTDCPHCYQELEVPNGEEIDKNQFIEPNRLRRVLQQVREREWENLRRELRELKVRNAKLEKELETAGARDQSVGMAAQCERLQRQLELANEKLIKANEALAESREHHGVTLDALRLEREQSRAAAESFRAELQASEAAGEQLRRLVHSLEAKLEVEHAKVFLMEAAGGANQLLSSSSDQALTESHDTVLIQELQLQVAELRKTNHALQRSRDSAKEELARLRQAQGEGSDERLNVPGASLSVARQKTLHLYQEQPIAGAS